MKKIFFMTIIFSSLFLMGWLSTSEVKAQELNKVRLYFFHTDSCPHCKAEAKFLNKIKNNYSNLEVQALSLEDEENLVIFKKVIKEYDLSGGVPVTLIGEKHIVGFNNEMGIGSVIRKRINECSDKSCDSFLDDELGLGSINGSTNNSGPETTSGETHGNHKTVQAFGRKVCLDDTDSLCFLGGVLGLADGVNPCMFSVLMFLLVYLMGIGSSKKAFKAGIAFVITTFLFYLLFMYGLIKVITVLEIAREVRITISVFALVVGLVMIKDYFFYGKWFSFEISKKIKPVLEKLTKKGTVASAVVLALLSSIVELPCTSGIPLAYVSILSTKGGSALGYLVLYNLFFVVPLLVILIGTIFIWKKVEKVEEWRNKFKKYMRLAAGVLLVLLSIAIWNNWL